MNLDLSEIKTGEEGIIIEIMGGQHFRRKLDSMGIRIGSKIKKLSSQFMHGPITIQVGSTQVALGFGMSKKIILSKDISQTVAS